MKVISYLKDHQRVSSPPPPSCISACGLTASVGAYTVMLPLGLFLLLGILWGFIGSNESQ